MTKRDMTGHDMAGHDMTRHDASGNRLHALMHRIPGVPPHEYAAERNHHHRHHPTHHRDQPNPQLARRNAMKHHQRPPRVLIGWQEWIARTLTRSGR
jgi:hypothetical protein